MAEFLIVPAHLTHVLPRCVPLEEAALLEPAAVVLGGLMATPPRLFQKVVVVGGGTLGILAAQLLALRRPASLVLVDPRASRRELARRLGATTCLEPSQRAELKRLGADLVVETAGAPGSVRLAASTAARGADLVLLGLTEGRAAELDMNDVVVSELVLHGVCGASTRAWAETVRLYREHALDLEALITHRRPLTDYERAMEMLGDEQTGKILLTPEPS